MYSFAHRIDLIFFLTNVDPWAHLPNQATLHHTPSSSLSLYDYSFLIFHFQFEFPIRYVMLCCFFIAQCVHFRSKVVCILHTHTHTHTKCALLLFYLPCAGCRLQHSNTHSVSINFFLYLFDFGIRNNTPEIKSVSSIRYDITLYHCMARHCMDDVRSV